MRRLLLALAFSLGLSGAASAQSCNPNFPWFTQYGTITVGHTVILGPACSQFQDGGLPGGGGSPGGTTFAVQYNAGAGTFAGINIGTAGRVLVDQGAGATAAWEAVSGDIAMTSAGVVTIQSAAVTNAKLATATANTFKGNVTGSTAGVLDNAWPSCSGGSSALQYTSGTGVSCLGVVATLTAQDQTISGGANNTAFSIGTVSTGTTTFDCGKNALQFMTNNGASTFAAPANDGSCIVLITNGASAGALTPSGWTVSTNTGDAFTTTNTNKFMLSVVRINGVATYVNKALQ